MASIRPASGTFSTRTSAAAYITVALTTFEATLPGQLTLGRPDQAAVIFGRRVTRQTPGRFHTKVNNRGTEAAIQIHFHASKVKQYFKEGRALRTETTVNDTRDFGVGRLLTDENWAKLIDIGHQVNQRLLDHQLDACACAPDATLLERVVLPSRTPMAYPPPACGSGTPEPWRCSPACAAISTSSPD